MKHEEHILQSECVKKFRLFYPHLKNLLFAIPNGGARTATTGAMLKKEGVMPGVADLFFVFPNADFHGLFIEMKTATGKQTPSQKEFEKEVTEQQYKYIVCRSVQEFMTEIKKYIRR